ncbi:MAG: Mu transposase C-terminal domain-containing protein [Sphingomonas sp.]|nr:Mu transposase C-terminal domain-containing protein [Sphingomonas sp.]
MLARTHLSAAEIAQLRLAGLPATKRGVLLLAGKAGWHRVDRPGPGGGFWFAVAELPEGARADLARRQAAANDAQPQRGRGRPKGSDYWSANPQVADAVEVLLAEQQLSASRIYELIAARFPGIPLPSDRTLRRRIAAIEASKPALLAYNRDPDLYRGKYRVSLGRADAEATHANHIWEIDTTKADVVCTDGRRSILGIVDVYSRRAKYLVVESESARSARATLLATISAWGVVPEILRTDQGSGFVNATMKTGLPSLGIELDDLPPARPDLKPHVERLFGTFTRERASLLGGFVGHNVAQAQKLRAAARRKTGRAEIVAAISSAELQTIIDNWVEGTYGQRVHSMTGEAPIARFLASPIASRRAPDTDTLRRALSAYVGHGTVTKKGVQWKRGSYWAEPLAAWMGQRVILRRDEDELGELFVFASTGEFICTALNHERAGFSERDFAMEARRQQAAWIKAQQAELRAKQREFRFDDMRDAVLRRDAEAAGKLHTLPPRTAPHTTPAIASMAADVAPPAMPVPAPRRREAVAPSTASVRERVAQTDQLLSDAAAGIEVDPTLLAQARAYSKSAEYRAEKILSGAFERPRIANQNSQWRQAR